MSTAIGTTNRVGLNGPSARTGGHCMRFIKLSTVALLAALLLLSATLRLPAAAPPTPAPRTYTVLVGAESVHRGIDVMAYFPGTRHDPRRRHRPLASRTATRSIPSPSSATSRGRHRSSCAASRGLPDTPSPLVFNPTAVVPTAPTDDSSVTRTTFVNSGPDGSRGWPGAARSTSPSRPPARTTTSASCTA